MKWIYINIKLIFESTVSLSKAQVENKYKCT